MKGACLKKSPTSQRPRRTDQIWFAIQLIALTVAVITPAFIKSKPREIGGSQLSTESESPSLSKIVGLWPNNERNFEASISSHVILLPDPETAEQQSVPKEIEISTKQLRFERVAHMQAASDQTSQTSNLRGPASVPKNTKIWMLDRIQKYEPRLQNWQNVSLIKGESTDPIGSIYVELSQGSNEFQVHYKNLKGDYKKYFLKINHSKND